MRTDSIFTKQKGCSVCNTQFICGDTAESACWCNQYPPIFAPDPTVDCLCKDCLHKATSEKINLYVNQISPEQALANNKAKTLPKTTHLIQGIDYYIENGLWVFTAWYHLKRGKCCKNNCKHCPYKLS